MLAFKVITFSIATFIRSVLVFTLILFLFKYHDIFYSTANRDIFQHFIFWISRPFELKFMECHKGLYNVGVFKLEATLLTFLFTISLWDQNPAQVLVISSNNELQFYFTASLEYSNHHTRQQRMVMKQFHGLRRKNIFMIIPEQFPKIVIFHFEVTLCRCPL